MEVAASEIVLLNRRDGTGSRQRTRVRYYTAPYDDRCRDGDAGDTTVLRHDRRG
jgi:hypothetical protein